MARDELLRDFLYLDIDRVRSLVAQLQQGMPDVIEKQVSQHGGGGIRVIEYAYTTQTTETRSVHHYLYTLLESALEETQRLTVVDEEYDSDLWTIDSLPDGTLVLVEGSVRIVDFQKLTEAMESLPHLFQVISQTQRLALKQQVQAGTLSQAQFNEAIRDLPSLGMDKKEFKGIVDLVGQLYSDTLRVKVFPLPERDHFFTGSLNVTHLQQPRGNIWLTGGVESQSKWWAMGIVNQVVADPDAASTVMGDTMEDKLESLYLTFASVNKVTSSIEFPAISFIPIAIYRCV